ncbi:hypothetical protein [Thermospira aquatica]|uniref:Uncharacterized protein n=1 Tax=Thermospira aquatica TaxID=2828656 RepID=A0AAX3BBQ9_9SPIR|nr:hypothetical protein [Thermospira aquatica]URA09726.1 hypothetical protein KDW03_09590 [Thermospira aquatica]
MKWYFVWLFPVFLYAQWTINDIFKISVKNTNSFSWISDWENISLSPLGIQSTTTDMGWLTLLDLSCGEGYLFSHIFADFQDSGNEGLIIEVHDSEDNRLLTNVQLLQSGSIFLENIFQRRIDVWAYLSPGITLYSFGIVRKEEIPLTPSLVLVNPKIVYHPEGILSVDFSLLSPAWIEVELYNKQGDRLASLIPLAYYTPGPLSIQWTPLSAVRPYLVSGSAYVYIRYRTSTRGKEWVHRFEIVYL